LRYRRKLKLAGTLSVICGALGGGGGGEWGLLTRVKNVVFATSERSRSNSADIAVTKDTHFLNVLRTVCTDANGYFRTADTHAAIGT
jgi:hypothetical protein